MCARAFDSALSLVPIGFALPCASALDSVEFVFSYAEFGAALGHVGPVEKHGWE